MELGSEESFSVALLTTLESVRERPSIRRATLLCDFFTERDGPGVGASTAKENMSERSLGSAREEGERGAYKSSSRTEVVTERARDLRGVEGNDSTSAGGVAARA